VAEALLDADVCVVGTPETPAEVAEDEVELEREELDFELEVEELERDVDVKLDVLL
jgi:hypothetical protein